MDRTACLRKEFIWKKIPFSIDTLSEKNSSGLTSPDSVSEKFNQLEQTPRKDDRLSGEKTKVDVVDQRNRKVCVTLLRYNEDRPESSTAQVLFFARKKEDEKFEQIVQAKYKFEEFFNKLCIEIYI